MLLSFICGTFAKFFENSFYFLLISGSALCSLFGSLFLQILQLTQIILGG